MMMSLGPISISKQASAHFPTTQPVTPIPSTRMSLLSKQAWSELNGLGSRGGNSTGRCVKARSSRVTLVDRVKYRIANSVREFDCGLHLIKHLR
jgi:hypothetical protein